MYTLQSLLVGIGFFVSSHIGLHTQLMILAPVGAISALAFTLVDKDIIKSKWTNEDWDSMDEEPTENANKSWLLSELATRRSKY